MDNIIYIYLSNGFYFGFISNGFLYSRDGICLGWLEGIYVWDMGGKYRGTIIDIPNNHDSKYILRKRFVLSPISRPPKDSISSIAPIAPPPNIKPVNLPVDVIDAFAQ